MRARSVWGGVIAACICALVLVGGTAAVGTAASPAGPHAMAAKKKCKKKKRAASAKKKCKKGGGGASVDIAAYLSGHRFSAHQAGSTATWDFCASGTLTITRSETGPPAVTAWRSGTWAVTSSAANHGNVHFVPTSAWSSSAGNLDPGDPEDFEVVVASATQADVDGFPTQRSAPATC